MATPSSARRLPCPGDVLAYRFLWSHESDAGRDDAVKERPCVVVIAVGEGDHPTVTVAPITSQPPARQGAIALRPGALTLDRPSWIIPWELNRFRWIGPDVSPAEHAAGAWWRIGALSLPLRRALRDSVAAALAQRQARLTPRTE
ncbi:MAG TPA: type II toxin-antitoxin system PemK/MazF family toxin [Caulobacteraceae bacterium]|jgi:hypothetical protein